MIACNIRKKNKLPPLPVPDRPGRIAGTEIYCATLWSLGSRFVELNMLINTTSTLIFVLSHQYALFLEQFPNRTFLKTQQSINTFPTSPEKLLSLCLIS